MSFHYPPPRPFMRFNQPTLIERMDALSARIDRLLRMLDEHDAYMHEWRVTGKEPGLAGKLLYTGRLRRSFVPPVYTKLEIDRSLAITTGAR